MSVQEKIDEIEKEIATAEKNEATEYHLSLLKAKLAKYRSQLLDSTDKKGEKGDGYDVMKSVSSLNLKLDLCPIVDESMIIDYKRKNERQNEIDLRNDKMIYYNPKYEDLFAPTFGPVFDDEEDRSGKNFLTGHIEDAHMSDVQFEEQWKTYHNAAKSKNLFNNKSSIKPSVIKSESTTSTDATTTDTADDSTTITSDEIDKKNTKQKRKRIRNNDPADVDNFVGPWAEYENELKITQLTEQEKEEIDQFIAKKKKVVYKKEFKEEEKSQLHIKDPYDYQGRSFLHPPQNLDGGVSLKYDHVPDKCFIPKRCIQLYNGHTKSVTAIRWFPVSGHLFLSSAMDSKIKLWEVYNERRCILTYSGDRQAVRDICFNRSGEQFVSCGYDRGLKLWDTETGACIKRFENRKLAYCVKFNTDIEQSHLFLTGMADKKILCWDSRSGSVVQEYDRHLGAVNTINFVDGNRRFVSTSDDKSLRVWDFDIPVDIKYIADPSMHAIPAVTPAPNGKWLACQFMDNKIQAFTCLNRFKLNNKKIFKGHMVAGYSCSPDFSPEMSYLISGDADGKIFVWDWKTTKLLTSFKAHDNVCTSVLWHPHETSKVLSCGWDNMIKLWD